MSNTSSHRLASYEKDFILRMHHQIVESKLSTNETHWYGWRLCASRRWRRWRAEPAALRRPSSPSTTWTTSLLRPNRTACHSRSCSTNRTCKDTAPELWTRSTVFTRSGSSNKAAGYDGLLIWSPHVLIASIWESTASRMLWALQFILWASEGKEQWQA